MSDGTPALSPVKQALLEIRELRARLAAHEDAAHAPLAVTGMALRLPGGVHDEDSLWRVLAEGRDAIGPVPPGRWDVEAHYADDPDAPGTMWTREGGFLDADPAGFDAAFFGIAPLEAASMDPQQRFLLELAWHALEDAGLAPDRLAGSRTGVFVGVGNTDFGRALLADPDRIDAYAGSGGSLAVVAGRIAYVLGLQGPALSIDTACSASLVALHQACRSLRSGECDLALVAGINLMLSPAAHIAFTKARMMARDGRCKTFDAAADGYGRGEGAVVLVLQRDRDALAQGARRLARIVGSAINQDGRSGGLTAPSGPQQEAVIRAALADARLAPADIDLVEAHGTGTPLGDPIELQALGAALGEGRAADRPLLVGSCKTNFGHLEAAAGLAGLAKLVVSLRRREVPPHLHFRTPNPLIPWARLPVEVPVARRPWPARPDGAPARAGVSAFGFSGTNAHVIVEAVADDAPAAAPADTPWPLLLLSARDDAALRELAAQWQARLEGADAAALTDLGFTASTGRARLPLRLAVSGADAPALQAALAAWREGRAVEGLAAGRAGTPKIAFVFSGQGPQHSGMAAGLYRRSPVFRAALDRCAQGLAGLLDVPLTELLFDERHAARLEDTAVAQPALFAVEIALAELWRALGVEPEVVLGHSLGEYAAACVAGLFPLDDALRALVQRGRLTAALPGEGRMLSVQASAAELRPLVAGWPDIEVAAFNGPRQTVLSGSRASIERLGPALDAAGLRWRALQISHAFHSAFVEPALAPYGEVLAGVRFGAARCAIVNNLHGTAGGTDEMATPGYWLRQMRAPVRFAEGLQALLATGVTHVIEIGPHPVLLGLAAEAAPDAAVAWLPSLRRGDDRGRDLAESLARLHADGQRVDSAPLAAARRVAAPPMPFQHRHHWIDGWHDGGRAAAGAFDSAEAWQRMGAALARQCDQAPVGIDVTGYAGHWAVLERLTVAHAAEVLRGAGLFAQAGETHDVAAVRTQLRAKASHDHLLQRWLERLADRGDLRRVAGTPPRFACDRPLPDPGLAACLDDTRRALAGDPELLAYLLHCGRLLPAVIRGEESPLETLFPGGSFALAEGIYQRSVQMRYVNALAAAALEALVGARGRAPLRALEVGAGTGSSTAALLPVLQGLPPGRASWLYTDVTPVFFEHAQAKFGAHPCVRFAAFDLERDPAAQGLAPGSFDLVFAANAVHATRDLRAALARLRGLLAPGGVLLLVESTEHLAWYDMTTGLIEGWQHFADDLRDDNPLLPSDTWQAALAQAGFDATGAWPPPQHEAARLGQQVIAAWVKGTATAAPALLPAAAAPVVATAAAPRDDLAARIAAATPDEQRDLLREALREAVRSVLRLPEPPARHDRLMEIGMDSLMAVQLRNRIQALMGLPRPLPATLMFDHPTVEALVDHLLAPRTATPPAETAAPAPSAPATPPPGAEGLAELSDAEVEALLLARLEKKVVSADPTTLSPIKRAFLALAEAEAKLAANEAAAREPIAVVGLGCRVPGADGPQALWQLLEQGRDAVGPIPRERFDIERFFDADTEQPGRIAVREAGFLGTPVDGFDAPFFGISPREARGMDPQQRLLLEVAWEALEHAGIAPDRLSGSATGVFVGQASSDWATLIYKAGDPALLDAHFTSGIAHSVTSGRLSYLLGLQGPSLTVDTACSSSLVAVHLACQSLRTGECRMALAGGVNLMLSEDLFIAFSHSRMLAPDGRCKTFDASADGFGRGEGCGVVVLKRLADARADGDRILALVRGSAVNQDGPSSGLTAPNGPQQEAVIRTALQRAGIAAADVGYVEAHGTGTQLGDPLEVQALGHVFGPGRSAAQPLLLGSVKTNLGHLEAAAGITGFIKLVLALQHRALPAHLHLRTPSPHIDWQGWPVKVPTTLQPWAPIGGRRIGGVSSFGYSGTNAHVVVEEAPVIEAPPAAPPKVLLYTLSARSEGALRTLAARHRDALDAAPTTPLEALCRTANAGRAAFAHRAAILATTRDELRARLDALAGGREAPGLRSAHLQRREPPRIAFLFTGQGSQHVGMARGLYDTVPAFRAALDRCAVALEPWLDVPLTALLFGAESGRLDHTACTQPALFAVGHALAETWRAFGIVPTVLLGHSVGEIAAACSAGVFTLEAAARLVGERARRMGALPAGGAMAAVAAPEAAVQRHLASHPAVAIAAANAPEQTVVAGAAEAVAALCRHLEAEGLRCQPLTVSHAFHSPLMEPMLDGFEAALQGLPAAPPRLRLVSALDGTLAGARTLAEPSHWRRQVREPVRFADGVRTLLAQKPDVCLEIGPQPALLGFVAPVAPELPRVASLRRGRADREVFLEALAALWLEGAAVDWRAVHEGDAGPPVAWPTYPFERTRCWFSARPAAAPAAAGAHPLLGARVRSAATARLHEGRVAADAPAWVVQHRVHGHVVLPATAWLDLLLAAAVATHGDAAGGLADVTVPQALLLEGETGRVLQTVIEPAADGGAAVRVASLPEDADADAPWTTHVTARLPTADAASTPVPSPDAARQACPEPVDTDAFYADFAARGLDFGPAFRSLVQIRRGAGQAFGEVRLHAELERERGRWQLHPVLLDGCLQLLAVALAPEAGALFLPLAIGRYRLLRRPAGAVFAHVVAAPGGGRETRRADVFVHDADGAPVAQLLDLQLKRVDTGTLGARGGSGGVDALLHEIAWRELPREQPLPAAAALATLARGAAEGLRTATGTDAYDAALPALDRLCAGFIAQALRALGQPAHAGAPVDAAALPVLPRHRALLARLLAILGEQGWLARDGGGWRVARDLAGASADADDPALAACDDERTMTARTGRGLAAALRGTEDPLQLLFPGGDTASAERVYRDAPPARFFNGLVAEVVAAAAQAHRGTRPLRVLEIGAGTGGTTAHVLPRLAPGSAHYTFTDVGNAFVTRARERFGGAAVDTAFQVFDLEHDGAAQGLADGAHDLVIASNVVHATRDLRASLRRIHRLLAPGGLLVMLEACAPQAWFDVTVGLTEGWWAFEDRDLRPDYPTLSRAAWLALLKQEGFAAEAVAGDPATPGVRGLNVLLVAQRRSAARRWLVVGAADGMAGALAQRLRARGDTCERVDAGAALTAAAFDGVVHAAALDAADARTIALDALHTAQALVARGTPARLWLATRGAQACVPTDACDTPAAAVLWGLARTLRLEHPELQTTVVDLDAEPAADALVAELQDDGTEPERALRGAVRRVPRLVPLTPPAAAAAAPPHWRLVPAQPGSLDAFVRQPVARRAPGPGEVEIAVEATGLNFKDVLNVLGLYPGEAGPLGGECAGRVVALGAGVDGLAPGDAVLALAGGSFASHVVAPAAFVRRLPAGVGMAEGATFAVAHVTAAFCLQRLAGLRAGQTVLVHAAAGGVGLAALRLARLAGATVYATAGAPWKHELLRALGARQVFDSRSTSFLDGVRAATAGRGVDVVLNSLAGDLIDPSFAALADGGCFVEIGKRGIRTPAEVAAMGRGLRYHVVDWGETAQHEPDAVGRLFGELVDRLADGTLAPLPRHDFDLADAPRAFRFMAQARHAGRIALRHAPATGWQPSPRGSYLVTGGLSGVGLAVARWLGERGAGRLVLVGRRGATPEAAPVLAALRARGVDVQAHALDVADEAGLAALLAALRAGGPPLRGVFHGAGVLDEAALPHQDAARFDTVFAPKLHGARLLDRLTRADALDVFVLFSSIAGVLGSAGQANHAAASAFLDALAHDRRSRGLAALAVDWGAWGEVGAAARDGVEARLAAQGLATFSNADALAALERLLARGSAQATVVAADWDVWRRRQPASAPLLEELARRRAPVATPAAASGGADVLAELRQAPPARRRTLVANLVRERALRVLGLDPGHALDPRAPLGDLGLDSLLAVELRNALGTSLKLALPATLLFDHPNVEALTQHLLDTLFPAAPPAAAPAPAPKAGSVLDAVADLSDDEVERRLAARKRNKT